MSLDTTNWTLPIDAFVRSIGVNKHAPHALLLGAGASVTSQVPTAEDCLWQWKRQIVLTQNPNLNKELYDLSIRSVRDKIQRILDNEGRYPAANSAEEYGFFCQECYPIPQDRRSYFQRLAEKAIASNGYRYSCLLALAGIIKYIWTTNFDGLANRVASSATGLSVFEAGIDTAQRAIRVVNQNEILVVYLHGDYRYDALKNTSEELREQDAVLSKELVRQLRDVNLIVIGYSGRDQSVMSALTEAYSQPGQGRLYWCGYEVDTPDDKVRALLEVARNNGRTAYYVSTSGFDDLILRLSLECLEGDLLKRAMDLRSRIASTADIKPPAFTVETATRLVGFAKSNVFELECPSQIYQFDVPSLPHPGEWKALRGMTKDFPICAGLLRDKVLAIGSIDDIKRAFGTSIESEITLVPVDNQELSLTNGVIANLFTTAIIESLAKARNLQIGRRDHDLYLWTSDVSQKFKFEDTQYDVHEGMFPYLRIYKGKTYLVLEPTLRITTSEGALIPAEKGKIVNNLITSKRYNHIVNGILETWRTTLFPDGGLSWGYPDDTSPFRFTVAAQPLYARIGTSQSGSGRQFHLSPHFQSVSAQQGTQYTEPPLIFSNKRGDGQTKDWHPIRGITGNRPYDFRLSEDILGREITMGVICPKADAFKLSQFLNALKQKSSPKRANDEYMMEYPGFDVAYGIPLDVPQPNAGSWSAITEPGGSVDVKRGATELTKLIKSAIDSLHSSTAPNVVVVYVPERWQKWERYELDDEVFDLHDVIKAYSIQRGIATQFIREKTLRYFEQCRVRWWVSLAVYVKAGRTPWVLDTTDEETAFVGIGYSVQRQAPRGRHIVIGCSHIYNSSGLGLGYRLSKIDDPEFDRRNNPHLSQEDARRIGENTKQLFHRSGVGIPKRVVIHKRTHFREEEIKGFLEGMSGIQAIDMVELTEEPALAYLNGKNVSNSTFVPDNFAIRRGTCIPIDSQKALLWVHGVADALQPGRRFFLGGRGIPSPMVLTRHYGTSSLATLANEVLGLSKMNWNNFELYSHIPATIDTSNSIARIGVLLERFGALQYDYRLFI